MVVRAKGGWFLESFALGMKSVGALAPAALILAYIPACLFLIPGSALSLAAGAVFGTLRGTIYVSAGSVLGACAAFFAGRYLARDWVRGRLAEHPRLEVLSKAVGKEGWKLVGLTRLSPVFPFNLLNYAYGVSEVSFRDYLLASWIGMLPGTLLYVSLGSLLGEATGVSEAAGLMSAAPGYRWVSILGFLATVAVAVLAGKRQNALGRNSKEPNWVACAAHAMGPSLPGQGGLPPPGLGPVGMNLVGPRFRGPRSRWGR